MNRKLLKDIQMTNCIWKKNALQLSIKEMQVQATRRCHLPPVRLGHIVRNKNRAGEISHYIGNLTCMQSKWAWSMGPLWSAEQCQEWFLSIELEVNPKQCWMWSPNQSNPQNKHKKNLQKEQKQSALVRIWGKRTFGGNVDCFNLLGKWHGHISKTWTLSFHMA